MERRERRREETERDGGRDWLCDLERGEKGMEEAATAAPAAASVLKKDHDENSFSLYKLEHYILIWCVLRSVWIRYILLMITEKSCIHSYRKIHKK